MSTTTTLYESHPELILFIFRECEKVELANTEKLENRVIKELERFIEKFPHHSRNYTVLRTRVRNHISSSRKRFKSEDSVVFSGITLNNEDGEEKEFDPVDVLANVESEVTKEMTVDLLAQADRRKRLILSEWANGNTVDTDISNVLANVLGGKASGHRIYIQRFRTDCKKTLLASAV